MKVILTAMNNKNIRIIASKSKDILICSEKLYESDFGKNYYPTKEVTFEILSKASQKDYMYIASINNEVVGFIWFSLDGMFGKFPYLNLIFIFPEFRNGGIANLLMEFFEKHIRKSIKSPKIKIFLLVKNGNEKARNLYEKLGYVEICVFKSLFRKGIDEILMTREIAYF